ncbi:unnamed protein product [Fusarium fujikuroi]|nr:unnamed protein product [Fusarium fujikuroi]
MDPPWFMTLNDFSEFHNFGHPFPGTNLPPSFEIPAPHEQALDGQFVADQSHSHAPPNPFSDLFTQELQNASSTDNMDGLGAAAQIAPTPTTGPPRKSRKKKAPTLRDEDFEPFKDRILELYETQKLSLEKVKSMIEEEFGFTAQPRQYQTRITKWGKDKNIKKPEMTAIARKHQQREILETDKRKLRFTVRGREVDAGKIDRWMDRNNVPRNDLYAPSPAASTPSAVDCRTISERGSLAHSPALSEMSLTFSTGGITPVAQSPMASSPALSVRGIIQGRGSTFIGQSPAPIYRALPAQLPASDPSTTRPVHPPSTSTLAPRQYRYKQADEDRLRSELSVAETLFGSEHVETLHILVMLTDVLLNQGRYKSAEETTRRAVAGYLKTVGGDDIRTLDALEHLGQVLASQGFYRQASKLLEELLDTKRVALGDEHRSTLSCMALLVTVYLNQHQWGRSTLLAERVLEISKRIWGEADDITQTSMADLGYAYMRLGRLEESKQFIGQAMILSRNIFGEEHPATLKIMSRLQALYLQQSNWGQAEAISIQVVNACMKVFGEEHPRTLSSKADLAYVYERLGQLEKAEEAGEEVLEIQRRILGESHPLTLQTGRELIISTQVPSFDCVTTSRRLLVACCARPVVTLSSQRFNRQAYAAHAYASHPISSLTAVSRSTVLPPDHRLKIELLHQQGPEASKFPMSNKNEALSSMDPFSPAHQPDEGYSEDPLTPTVNQELSTALSTALATLRSPSDLSTWLVANSSLLPLEVRTELTMALLDNLPTSVIAEIVHRLNPRLYIDFIQYLPAEICLKILGFLDPVSLVSVTQTCRAWYELALDRKLWERLYYMEGWKTIMSEIEACETKVNNGLDHSIRHLNRLQSMQDAHPNKIRAVVNSDDDLEMTDRDRTPGPSETLAGGSMFGSPSSSFSSSRPAIVPMGEMDLDGLSSRNTSLDRTLSSSSDSRGKRKEPSEDTESSLASMSLADAANTLPPSSLYIWDVGRSRYRINWRYLYGMRRKLEANWELGKYTTFQFPHPNFPEEGHQECVYALQFDKDYLVSGSRDQTMRIWNVRTRRLVRPPLTGHMGSVLCLQFDADPEEDLLVSGSSDSNVFIWKFSTGELVQKLTRAHHESVLNVRFDKRILVTSSKDKTIKIFNRRPLRHGDLGYNGGDLVGPVPVHLRRYGYEPDLSQELPVKPPFTMIGRLDGHSAAVNAIQVRDETIVSVSGDRHIKIWSWPDQACTRTIPAHDKGIACVEFDGRRIVSGSSDWEVCIFDAPTGLKVAQLRGHAHLVRTVQAGFGDLPYSTAEDWAEAKAVDAEYMRALEAGEIDNAMDRRHRRDRRANAGSSRPQDVQAYGAKVPPGGGGGRKYGRIVSGSYDQSIIIWRRDKEGVWKPAIHLRQEEAAAAAQREAAASLSSATSNVAIAGSLASRSSHASTIVPRSPPTSGSPLGPLMLRDHHGDTQRTANSYQVLIDQAVPLGPNSLQHALATYPIALAHHSYLQTTIERETSPLIRAQLRGVVTDALANLQIRQMPMRQQSSSGSSHMSSDSGRTNPRSGQAPHAVPVAGGPAAQPPANNHAQGAPPVQPAQPPVHNGHHAGHHPHIAAAENTSARVFKLQFDAHKIICCSQTPTIVGWDFCNKDPALEEAVRFFATVD